MQLGAAAQYVAYGFIGAGGGCFGFAGLFVFPHAHGHVLAGGQVLFALGAFGGVPRIDFGDGGIGHGIGLGKEKEYLLGGLVKPRGGPGMPVG